MIDSSDKISNFPPEFNELEERVKSLEKRVADLERFKEEKTQ